MTVREILLLGNPRLYERSEEVLRDDVDSLKDNITDLRDTLMDFRKRYGAGRAIAAPQIGIAKRVIYMNIDGTSTVFINPKLKNMSDEMMEIWDDCMSFPHLLVRVLRHRSCDIEFRDENWNLRSLHLRDSLSELLQHEYDHLEGILAVDRAIDLRSFRYRGHQ